MRINDIQFDVDLMTILLELKNQLALQGLSYFGAIKDSGDNIMVSCPYHKGGQERKPSGGFKKSDGTFHCFTCSETHSLQEVISYCFGRDDRLGKFGWDWLLKNFLTIAIEDRKPIELDLSRKHETQKNIEYVSEEELDSYRYYHPYMKVRKLTDDVIDLFDIGYDSATNALTFPIHDTKGNVLHIARRSVATKWFNYPSGIEKPLYGIYQLYLCNPFPSEVYICESMLDCLTLWGHGKYAVALNGLGTDLQFRQLNSLPCRKFILATDSDEAGMRARNKLRTKLRSKIVTELILPKGRKDVNECTSEEIDAFKDVL